MVREASRTLLQAPARAPSPSPTLSHTHQPDTPLCGPQIQRPVCLHGVPRLPPSQGAPSPLGPAQEFMLTRSAAVHVWGDGVVFCHHRTQSQPVSLPIHPSLPCHASPIPPLFLEVVLQGQRLSSLLLMPPHLLPGPKTPGPPGGLSGEPLGCADSWKAEGLPQEARLPSQRPASAALRLPRKECMLTRSAAVHVWGEGRVGHPWEAPCVLTELAPLARVPH